MSSRVEPGPNGTWARVNNVEAVAAGVLSDSPAPTVPYQLTIAQADPPHHAVVVDLHDHVPTPTEGGGGWEEVQLPRRPAVLIWKGRGLMKMGLSVIFDGFISDTNVNDGPLRTLLHFWRPEGGKNSDTEEPSVLTLASKGSVVPYTNLRWIIDDLEWGEAQGNAAGERTAQILMLTFKEFRADVRLKPGGRPAVHPRTKPHKVKPHETLGSIARKYGISQKALGAMQKPPIRDSRNVKVGQMLIVPATRK